MSVDPNQTEARIRRLTRKLERARAKNIAAQEFARVVAAECSALRWHFNLVLGAIRDANSTLLLYAYHKDIREQRSAMIDQIKLWAKMEKNLKNAAKPGGLAGLIAIAESLGLQTKEAKNDGEG